jgi:hypothetical protein
MNAILKTNRNSAQNVLEKLTVLAENRYSEGIVIHLRAALTGFD